MFTSQQLDQLLHAIEEQTSQDHVFLEELLTEVEQIRPNVSSIRPRTTTAVSLVASDGGNNRLQFDPFQLQVVRVVDSYGSQLCLDVVSPSTDIQSLGRRQFDGNEQPITPLGLMMADLGITPSSVEIDPLRDLSHMIPKQEELREKQSWLQVYRDLCEWATLYGMFKNRTYGTDTLIVRDGLLRSKLFRHTKFIELMDLLHQHASAHLASSGRKLLLVGLAKHSKVLQRYELAMRLGNLIPGGSPKIAKIPRMLEAKAYVWPEYAASAQERETGTEVNKFVAGCMYFVRFGPSQEDPIWCIDIFDQQVEYESEIAAYLLADAIDGFPVPLYPMSLQKAHSYAELSGFDMEILQDYVIDSIRSNVEPNQAALIDAFRLRTDVSARRY